MSDNDGRSPEGMRPLTFASWDSVRKIPVRGWHNSDATDRHAPNRGMERSTNGKNRWLHFPAAIPILGGSSILEPYPAPAIT